MKKIYAALAGLVVIGAPAVIWAANADGWHHRHGDDGYSENDGDRDGGDHGDRDGYRDGDRDYGGWRHHGHHMGMRDGGRDGRGGRHEGRRGGENHRPLTDEQIKANTDARFAEIDKNHDGVITKDEAAQLFFPAPDANGDGKITPDELVASASARIKAHQEAMAAKRDAWKSRHDENGGSQPATPVAPATPAAPVTPPATPAPATPTTPQ